jgi:hypothetical protein
MVLMELKKFFGCEEVRNCLVTLQGPEKPDKKEE